MYLTLPACTLLPVHTLQTACAWHYHLHVHYYLYILYHLHVPDTTCMYITTCTYFTNCMYLTLPPACTLLPVHTLPPACTWHYHLHVHYYLYVHYYLHVLDIPSCTWHYHLHVLDITTCMYLTLPSACTWHYHLHVPDITTRMYLTLPPACTWGVPWWLEPKAEGEWHQGDKSPLCPLLYTQRSQSFNTNNVHDATFVCCQQPSTASVSRLFAMSLLYYWKCFRKFYIALIVCPIYSHLMVVFLLGFRVLLSLIFTSDVNSKNKNWWLWHKNRAKGQLSDKGVRWLINVISCVCAIQQWAVASMELVLWIPSAPGQSVYYSLHPVLFPFCHLHS